MATAADPGPGVSQCRGWRPPGDGKGLGVDLGVAARAALGPVKVVFDGLGISTELALTRGRLEPVDLKLGFLFPRGIGIEVVSVRRTPSLTTAAAGAIWSGDVGRASRGSPA